MGFSDLYKASLDTLHSDAAYGEPVIYRPSTGGSHEVQGVFTIPYEEVEPNEIPVQSTQPILSVRDDEFVALGVPIRQRDQVDVRGQAYWVSSVQPDGEGGTRLHLSEVNE